MRIAVSYNLWQNIESSDFVGFVRRGLQSMCECKLEADATAKEALESYSFLSAVMIIRGG